MADADLGIEGITGAEAVGQGGFGTVYRAEQPAFRRTVAVKILHAPDRDEAAQLRFRRECQAMGSLADHPNIVTLYDAGFLDDGRAFIVMAFMGGGSLHELAIAPGSMAWEEIVGTGIKLAGALETAHRAGILHRDLKPANVLISSFGEPQLTDFGIARIAGGHETRSGLITASIPYAPPEILDGRPPTVASDVYGLAATLVHLAIGRPPFTERTDESNAPILRRVYIDDVPDLAPRGVPAPVSAVLRSAMDKDAARRVPSAEAFGQALQTAERQLGRPPTPMQIQGPAPTPSTHMVVAAPPPPPPPPPPPASPPPPPHPVAPPAPAGTPSSGSGSSRSRAWLVGAAVAVVAALVVGGIVALTRSGDDAEPEDPPAASTGAGTSDDDSTDDTATDDGTSDDDSADGGSGGDTITLGDTVEGQLTPGAVAVYRFDADAGDTMAATLSTDSSARRVELIDPDGRSRVMADELCFASENDQARLTAGLPSAGMYTLTIEGDGDFALVTEANPDLFTQTPFVAVTVEPRRPDQLSRYYGFSTDGDLLVRVADTSGDLVAYSDDCGDERNPVVSGAATGGPVEVEVEVFGDLPSGTTVGLLDAARFSASGGLADSAIIGVAAELTPGEVWRVTARSDDNDALITMIDPAGNQVATDDDSAGGFDASVGYRAVDAGVHEVVLSFLGPGGGEFAVEATIE